MISRKNVLTTGEVARICCVAPRTVSKWFDSGQLRGYRIPGSKDRRIPVEHLVRFMRAHEIPLNGLDSGCTRVLVLDDDAMLWRAVREALAEDEGIELIMASDAFEAGALAREFTPQVLLVDVTLPEVCAKTIARRVRGMPDLQEVHLMGMASGLTEPQGQALLQDGFHAYLAKPFDTRTLVGLIDRVTAGQPEPESASAR
ncbi:MAG: response regulator [Planctomycetes bacterium]|nr:response regulator [Planctomycetota bacterium]